MLLAPMLFGLLALQTTTTAATPPSLDPRIDPKRVTTLPAPEVRTVADVVRAPAPEPVLRIASRAESVPLDAGSHAKARAAL
jgi:hypothetical protein